MSSASGDPAGFEAADVAVLRRLPTLLLREGYSDACSALRLTDLRRPQAQQQTDALPSSLRALVGLFALGQLIEPESLGGALSEAELTSLRRLGIILEHGGGYHTAGLLLVPFFGQMFFMPQPGDGEIYFGDDSAALVARLGPPRHARCLDLWSGPGVQALRLGTLAHSVVAVDSSPVAIACAELNVTLNSLEDRVALRQGDLFEVVDPGERFELVSGCPPVLPFPPELPLADAEPTGDDGLLMLRRLLDGLPAVLSDDGTAQIVAGGVGDERGPHLLAELAQYAAQQGLQIAVSVPARVPLRPGDHLFEVLADRCQRLGGLRIEAARKRLQQHFAASRGEYLYRLFLTISRSRSRPALKVATYYQTS